ncbi:RHS repeat domain-containing protein [Streptomyces sp. NPDC002896]|uniref:RHS repeat domain-containing protein n=1 Tax=Streptomyces sp. NPDC002896 TaxID=3154438 RepID=UPI003318D74C
MFFATGGAVKVTDTNGKVTESEYDSLGRVTSVWQPNRSKALGKTRTTATRARSPARPCPYVIPQVSVGTLGCVCHGMAPRQRWAVTGQPGGRPLTRLEVRF